MPPGTKPALPYSPAVVCGGLLVTSGHASVDERGAIVPGTFEEEMHRSMAGLRATLAAAFSEPWPARTTITNCLGPIRFEIEAVAELPGGGGGR